MFISFFAGEVDTDSLLNMRVAPPDNLICALHAHRAKLVLDQQQQQQAFADFRP